MDRPATKVELEWMKTSLIYFATPYSKYRRGFDLAAEEASRLAARLAQATEGAIFSPIAHSHAIVRAGGLDPIEDTVAWRALNAMMLTRADILVVAHMEGWQESEGIAEEVAFFERVRRPIFDLVDLDRLHMVRRQPQRPVRERIDGLPHDAIERDKSAFLEHRT